MTMTIHCPFLNDGCCRLIAEELNLDFDDRDQRQLAVVTENACKTCQSDGLDDETDLNQVIASLSMKAARENDLELKRDQADYLDHLKRAKSGPSIEVDEAEERFPCQHRSTALREHTCKPCLGRRTLPVYRCRLFHRECTILSSDAVDSQDEKKVEICHLCDQIADPDAPREIVKMSKTSAFDRKNQTPHKPPTRIPGMITSGSGLNADCLWNMANGREAFLLCCGPSLRDLDVDSLRRRGIFTMAINNQGANETVDFRPSATISMDRAGTMHPAIWQDPSVMSFTTATRSADILQFYNSKSDEWVGDESQRVRDQPNTWLFKHRSKMSFDEFLKTREIIFGGDYTLDNGAPRPTLNTMCCALRLLHYLGFRAVYLLGCDFWMSREDSYAFEIAKGGGAGSNNTTYGILNDWFARLRPHFERERFYVFNCTPESNLTAFDYIDLSEAISSALRTFPSNLKVTKLYGREKRKT